MIYELAVVLQSVLNCLKRLILGVCFQLPLSLTVLLCGPSDVGCCRPACRRAGWGCTLRAKRLAHARFGRCPDGHGRGDLNP